MVQEQVATTVEYDPGFWNQLSANTDPDVWNVKLVDAVAETSVSHAGRQPSGSVLLPSREGTYIFFDTERSGDTEWIVAATTGRCWNWTVEKLDARRRITEEGPENRTRLVRTPREIEEQVTGVFEKAQEERFEDGMESDFSTSLVLLIKEFGRPVIETISYLIRSGKAGVESASEALRWIGRVDDEMTYDYRIWLLEHSLSSSSAMVRDGAALGLASMDDHHAIDELKKAISSETCRRLRESLEQVLRQLER